VCSSDLQETGVEPRLISYRHPEAAAHLPLLTETPIAPLPSPPVFLIKGEDIVKAGVRPGPEIGRLLHQVEDRWIGAGFPEGRIAQIALMKAALAEV